MSDISDRYRRLAGGFTARVNAVPMDRWSSPSPCEGWTAAEVVAHVAEAATLFLELVDRQPPPGPSASEDPVGAWEASRDAIQAGLDDPEIAGLDYEGELGRATFEMAIDRFASPDLVIHTWDLSRAVGLDGRHAAKVGSLRAQDRSASGRRRADTAPRLPRSSRVSGPVAVVQPAFPGAAGVDRKATMRPWWPAMAKLPT